MAALVVLEEQVEIPSDLRDLSEFRAWAQSERFPERGRIDYVAGRIEVEMAPEEFFSHGTLKIEIARVLANRVKRRRLGHLVSDRTRVSSVRGDVSAEPDVVFLSHDTLASGRARLVPKSTGELGRYVEVEGAPDLIVEIVSDASVVKDTRRLPEAYFQAGVREFWLADARRQPLVFRIHRRGRKGFQAVRPDTEGFARSEVFACSFRLDGRLDEAGNWIFDLEVKKRG